MHILRANYMLALLVSLQIGKEQNDHQLKNMAVICFFDILVEFLDVFPGW